MDAMWDLLNRIQRAQPGVEAWMSDLHARNAAQSTAASATGFARLGQYFPASILEGARAVTVDRMPFPPVVALGLPEFEALAAMPMAGITFGHMYFLHRDHAGEALHFHELVHVVQWAALGVAAFLPTYAVGIVQHGYEASPFELAAYDLQAKFERGNALPGIVDFIRWHADETRKEAESLFQSVGLTMATRRG
jgi:hypothetical protein